MIVIRTSRWRLAGLLILSFGFVAAGFWFLLFPPAGVPLVPFVIQGVGIISILFFGLCGGILLKRLTSHRVALILDRVGLLDNSSATPAGRIRWEEIAGVQPVVHSKVRFLGIDLKDRDAFYARVNRAAAFRENEAFTGFPVLISAIVLDRKIEELMVQIDRYRKDRLARETLGVDPRFP